MPTEVSGDVQTIEVNGETREFLPPLTVGGLLEQHRLAAERVVVELNREIMRQDGWTGVQLSAGDRIEIVQLVGGG